MSQNGYGNLHIKDCDTKIHPASLLLKPVGPPKKKKNQEFAISLTRIEQT